MRARLALALFFTLAIVEPAPAAKPLTWCGTVGRGADEHAVARRGPVSCRRAREIVRTRAIRGRAVGGWRCTRDARGLDHGLALLLRRARRDRQRALRVGLSRQRPARRFARRTQRARARRVFKRRQRFVLGFARLAGREAPAGAGAGAAAPVTGDTGASGAGGVGGGGWGTHSSGTHRNTES